MTDDIRAGFIRQRRNLIVISLVLLFAEVADLKVKELNVFGNKIEIGSPVAVDATLWVAWLYWFWRYCVYFFELGDQGFFRARYTRLHRLLERDTDKLLAANLASQMNIQCPKEDIRVSYAGRHVGRMTIASGETVWRIRVTNCSVTCSGANGPLPSYPDYEVFVTGKLIAHYERKALWQALVRTRFVSEYAVPFGLAALPPLYWLVSIIC